MEDLIEQLRHESAFSEGKQSDLYWKAADALAQQAQQLETLQAEFDSRTSQMIIHYGQALACSKPVARAYESLRGELQYCHKQIRDLKLGKEDHQND